ncbi:hypothetical protein Leryth_016379, partial [Lithospermum erythrorhizon]
MKAVLNTEILIVLLQRRSKLMKMKMKALKLGGGTMMSGLFVHTAKQGQPKLILSLGFHTSNPSTPSPYHTDLFRDTYQTQINVIGYHYRQICK